MSVGVGVGRGFEWEGRTSEGVTLNTHTPRFLTKHQQPQSPLTAFVGKLAPAGRLSSCDFHDLVARVRNLANRHCLGRMVGVMEGGYCCRPPEEGAGAGEDGVASLAAVVDLNGGGGEGEESDQEVEGEEVHEETIQHCVAATCRAMAGL